MLVLLLGALFLIYRMGARAWAQTDAHTELLQSLQIVTARVSREMERSHYGSVSLGASGRSVAFLSPLDEQGFALQPDGSLEWRRYLVFYWDGTDKVFVRDLPLAAGDPQIYTPTPVETYDGPWGVRSVDFYANSGRLVSRQVVDFLVEITPPPERLFRVKVKGERKRYGDSTPEAVEVERFVFLRNGN